MYRDSGATVSQGAGGYWWSQGAYSSINARALELHGNYTGPEVSNSKTYGFSVRRDQGSTRVNDILHQFPFSLPYSGGVGRDSGATVHQGTYGDWWSQGASSNTDARYLDIRGNYTHPENNYYKTNGFSVHYHPVPQFSRSSLSANAEKRLDTMKRE